MAQLTSPPNLQFYEEISMTGRNIVSAGLNVHQLKDRIRVGLKKWSNQMADCELMSGEPSKSVS
jgi:hypothetical protein